MDRLYKLYGINTAIDLLRPDAKWQFNGMDITIWDDPRPKPTMEEINETMEKIKAFEESIPTIWTDSQLKRLSINMPHMFANQVMGLTDEQVGAINALTSLEVNKQALSTDQVSSLSTDQVPALSTDQISALTTDQI